MLFQSLLRCDFLSVLNLSLFWVWLYGKRFFWGGRDIHPLPRNLTFKHAMTMNLWSHVDLNKRCWCVRLSINHLTKTSKMWLFISINARGLIFSEQKDHATRKKNRWNNFFCQLTWIAVLISINYFLFSQYLDFCTG